jgi:hypothetical protein
MRRLLITGLFCKLFIFIAFSQSGDHTGPGTFTKTIEYNRVPSNESNDYNIRSKGGIEKLLFGDRNAPVEFYYDPAFAGYDDMVQCGFRIMRDSLDKNYILEIKRISNYEEAREKAKEYQPIGISGDLMGVITNEIRDLIAKHNREVSAKNYELVNSNLRAEAKSFPISEQFAEKMCEKMSSLIRDFKAINGPVKPTEDANITYFTLILDGSHSTFRTVVGVEVWSLVIHEPTGNSKKMSDFCLKIISDANNNQLNEKSYIEFLTDF